METRGQNKFTLFYLLYFIFLNIILTTDVGFTAPLIAKIALYFGVERIYVSWLISIMAIASAAFLPVWGVIADIVNRVKLIFIIVLSGAFVSFLTIFTISFHADFWIFGVMRFLAVVINASLGPAVFSLLVDLVPSKNRGAVIGWMGIAGTAAVGLGYIVSGIIPPLIYGSDFPLEFPFWFDFFAGLFFCGLTFRLKEPKRGGTDEGLRELYEKGETYTYTLTFDGALDFFRNPLNRKMFVFQFLIFTVNTMLGTYFITFLEVQHGREPMFGTIWMFIIFGIQLVGQIYWGGQGDKNFREKKDGRLLTMIKSSSIALCFLIPVFLVPFNFNGGVGLFYLFALILAIGSFFGVGVNPNSGVVVADLNFPEVRATVNSLMFLAHTAALAISAPLFVTIAESTPLNYSGTYFMYISICLPLALLILLSMRKSIIPGIEKIQVELQRRTEF